MQSDEFKGLWGNLWVNTKNFGVNEIIARQQRIFGLLRLFMRQKRISGIINEFEKLSDSQKKLKSGEMHTEDEK